MVAEMLMLRVLRAWIEGQITRQKSRTLLIELLQIYLEILKNPFIFAEISYALCKGQQPLGLQFTIVTFLGLLLEQLILHYRIIG